MNENLAVIIIVVIFAVGAYFAWKILIAALKGIGIAGRTIKEEGPSFFGSVFKSMIAGIISGIIVAVVAGVDFQFSGAATLGVGAGVFIKEMFA